MDARAISNVDGDSNDGALSRFLLTPVPSTAEPQSAVVSQFTDLVVSAASDPSLSERTWVLLTEAIEGGWGLAGHANTNDELVQAARAQLAELAKDKAT